MPPCAEPTAAPTRPGGRSRSPPASSSASRAAAAASCAQRSIRRASRRENQFSGSKPSIGQSTAGATPGNSTSCAPLRPAARESQKASTPLPVGAITPSPVTTTRRTAGACRTAEPSCVGSAGGSECQAGLPARPREKPGRRPRYLPGRGATAGAGLGRGAGTNLTTNTFPPPAKGKGCITKKAPALHGVEASSPAAFFGEGKGIVSPGQEAVIVQRKNILRPGFGGTDHVPVA